MTVCHAMFRKRWFYRRTASDLFYRLLSTATRDLLIQKEKRWEIFARNSAHDYERAANKSGDFRREKSDIIEINW